MTNTNKKLEDIDKDIKVLAWVISEWMGMA